MCWINWHPLKLKLLLFVLMPYGIIIKLLTKKKDRGWNVSGSSVDLTVIGVII